MNREYLTLEMRAVDDELRIIEGIANSSSVDSFGTVIEPRGAEFTLPLPLFFHENRKHGPTPIGHVTHTELRDGKWWFRAQVPKIEDDGTEGGRSVKHRIDAAWADIKHGLVRGASIEFEPLEPRSNTAKRWTKWRWAALAIVPIPSNRDATISVVRSAFQESPGLSGTTDPGLTGQPKTKDRGKPMTIKEQLTEHENSRAAKVAQREAIIAKCGEEKRTPEPDEKENLETLALEIRSHDEFISTLREQATMTAEAAQPINGKSTAAAALSRSAAPVVRVNQVEEPGLGFARYVMSLLACNGNRHEAAEYARSTWGEQGDLVAEMHRAAVAAGTTTTAAFAGALVQTNYLNDFLELMRPRTLLGRIPGLRRVPFNVSVGVQTAGGTVSWVGQGVLKPVTNVQVSAVTLGIAKAAAIVVITEELARSSTPSAQGVVRDSLINDMQTYLDTQLTDPAVAAVANVSPASLTNGVVGTAASGTGEADARADLRGLVADFAAANYGLGGLVLLMGEALAFTIGTMVNANTGELAFPGLGVGGGSIMGIPVVTSNVTPLATRIVAVHAPSVLLADDGQTVIDISREASVIMDSAPSTVTQAAGAASIYTSLWQANLVGIRAERWINWGKARATAVDMIHTIAYV
jgi:HK97 family phage major capsid protein